MDIYGLVGFPLQHSFSAGYFANKFKNENIDALYLNFEIEDIAHLQDIIVQHPNLRGFNVTIPYKEKVIPCLNELSVEAKEIGAVNVVKVTQTAEQKIWLKGHNTDYIGFRESIMPLLNNEIHKKALILGTGGASKAVAYALETIEIPHLFVSRTKKNNTITYDDVAADILNDYSIIINASPLGTFPHVETCPPIPYHLLTRNHVLYDLVYNPEETKFLKLGREKGALLKNGKEMLELQALAAWKIWQHK